jgi:plastocyanin
MRLATKLVILVLPLLFISSTAVAVLPDVTMTNFKFEPTSHPDVQGGLVTWQNDAVSTTHSTTSNNRSWTSTDVAPGNTATLPFDDAGTFLYHCRFHPSLMKGRILIPLEGPSSGTKGTPFNVKWAATSLTSPFVEDIQIHRPGRRGFANWHFGQTITNADFTPGRTGTFRFRARLRNKTTGRSSAFSQVLSVPVS